MDNDNIFARVKATISCREAAERYGLKVNRNGMICCPFHQDNNPSMRVDERFYCYGCHETGSVIDFVAKLYSLTAYQAAKKLESDFSNGFVSQGQKIVPNSKGKARATNRERTLFCIRVYTDFEQLLKQWRTQYAPVDTTAEWDNRFVFACRELVNVGYILDCLFEPIDPRDEEGKNLTAEELIESGDVYRVKMILDGMLYKSLSSSIRELDAMIPSER